MPADLTQAVHHLLTKIMVEDCLPPSLEDKYVEDGALREFLHQRSRPISWTLHAIDLELRHIQKKTVKQYKSYQVVQYRADDAELYLQVLRGYPIISTVDFYLEKFAPLRSKRGTYLAQSLENIYENDIARQCLVHKKKQLEVEIHTLQAEMEVMRPEIEAKMNANEAFIKRMWETKVISYHMGMVILAHNTLANHAEWSVRDERAKKPEFSKIEERKILLNEIEIMLKADVVLHSLEDLSE